LLDLVGASTTMRFNLPGLPPVTGARGLRQTIVGRSAVVTVNIRGEASNVTVSGRLRHGAHGVAIFYRNDFDVHPVARALADAAEREWAMLARPATPPVPRPTLTIWPDPDARPTY
jgi:hypothetical protein